MTLRPTPGFFVEERKLNTRQMRFLDAYFLNPNATQAAITAGYSKKTAGQQGHDLLKHPEICRILKEKTQESAAKLDVSAEKVLKELNGFAHSDIKDAFNEADGTLKRLSDMPEGLRKSIKSIKFTELFEGASGEKFCAGRIVDIAFWDKPKGLELIGKHLKMFTEKIEVSGKLSLEQLVEAAANRGK